MINACIFDLDGVIVDTAHYHYLSWCKLSEYLGFKFDYQHNEKLKGISRMASLDIVLDVGGIQKTESEKIELCKIKNDWYIESIQSLNPDDTLKGVREFIIELKANSIKVGLGSASKNARPVLNALELTQYFDAIVDGTDVTKSKPDPEVFIKGSELLNIQPSETVVFEDAAKGIEAAITGGFKNIAVGTHESLNIADFRVENFIDFNMKKMNALFNNQIKS